VTEQRRRCMRSNGAEPAALGSPPPRRNGSELGRRSVLVLLNMSYFPNKNRRIAEPSCSAYSVTTRDMSSSEFNGVRSAQCGCTKDHHMDWAGEPYQHETRLRFRRSRSVNGRAGPRGPEARAPNFHSHRAHPQRGADFQLRCLSALAAAGSGA
jgi:hypothetical protein